MKCSRFFLLVLALLLFTVLPAAGEEAYMFSCVPIDGVEVVPLAEFSAEGAPAGLEGLYGLFGEADPGCSVYMFRMPAGRVLASLSCMPLEGDPSATLLHGHRQQLREGLALALDVKPELIEEFRLDELNGYEALKTTVMLRPDDAVTLTLQAYLIPVNGCLMELWTAGPSPLSYVFDQTANNELKADNAALTTLLDSLAFEAEEQGAFLPMPDKDAMVELPHIVIADDAGIFRISAPLDTIAIHKGTDADTVARARMLAAESEGGGECFDVIYQNTLDSDCWMLYSREYGLTLQVHAVNDSQFKGVSNQAMLLTADSLLGTLQEQFESVVMIDEVFPYDLDGIEHLWFSYSIEHKGMALLTYVICAGDGQGQLYEVDVYIDIERNPDRETVVENMMMMLESVDYYPDAAV